MIATNNGSFPWRDSGVGRDLLEGRKRHADGALPPDELRALEDRVVRFVIEAQEEAGLDLIPDGPLRGEDPARHLALRLSGVTAGEPGEHFPTPGRPYTTPLVDGEVAWPGPLLVEDYLFARGGSGKAIKVVTTGPFTLAGIAVDRVYGDPNALAMSLAIAINRELRALSGAGADFIQIDEPAILGRPEAFPIFSRLWEVLGRGIAGTLCLHLAEGAIADLYSGLIGLKRLGCLSVDAIRTPGNLDVIRRNPPPGALRVGLGVIDPRGGGSTAADIVRLLDGCAGMPPRDRLLLGTASDLGALPAATAGGMLRELAEAVRSLNAAGAV
jgi:5-methyltetrahydropteroyltriglutamate--homocysteine methyltransferase